MSQAVEHALIQHVDKGDSFEGVYYVESAYVKQTTQKKDYTDFMLRDKSGARNVKYWGVVNGVSKGCFVFIAASVDEYQGNPSIVAKNVENTDAPEDMSDFMSTYEDANKYATAFDKLRAELAECEKVTGNSIAGMLVDEVYKNAAFFQKFVVAPGSGRPHYGRQGGLLANVVRVAEAALCSASQYGLNEQEKSILISSALLSRIGAIEAFEFRDCMPNVTKKGILLGINNLTMTRITSALKRAVAALSKENKTVDQDTVVRILHAVTAHDGVSVQPMTKEAMVLNAAFKSDANIVDAMDFIASDVNKNEEFTAWDPSTGRKYYTGVRAE